MIESKYSANDLRKKIRIKKVIKTKNNFNEDIYSYSNFITTYAKIEQTPSINDNTEMHIDNKILNRYTKKFTIRYLSNLTDEMKIYYNGIYYRITNINDIEERHIFLELTCEKVED